MWCEMELRNIPQRIHTSIPYQNSRNHIDIAGTLMTTFGECIKYLETCFFADENMEILG